MAGNENEETSGTRTKERNGNQGVLVKITERAIKDGSNEVKKKKKGKRKVRSNNGMSKRRGIAKSKRRKRMDGDALSS